MLNEDNGKENGNYYNIIGFRGQDWVQRSKIRVAIANLLASKEPLGYMGIELEYTESHILST